MAATMRITGLAVLAILVAVVVRARLAGWRCRYVPTAVAHHRGSVTAGAASAWKAYHVERNRRWLVWKHFPMGLILVSPLVTARLL